MTMTRRSAARSVRAAAGEHAAERPHPEHVANGDELRFRHVRETTSEDRRAEDDTALDGGLPSYLASFTKGLAHNPRTGLIEVPDDFTRFVRGIDSGELRDFQQTPLGPDRGIGGGAPTGLQAPDWHSDAAAGADVRAWESAAAGATFDLEGPDAQAVTMPPAPRIGSAELTAEMGEVYAQAILRDLSFENFHAAAEEGPARESVQEILNALNGLDWFSKRPLGGLSTAERRRRRQTLALQSAFRGVTPGDDVGPYVSQFLLAGNLGIGSYPEGDTLQTEYPHDRSGGYIQYGAVRVDQRVRFALPEHDYMTGWEQWLDVQNGADIGARQLYHPRCAYRFITTPRDLATYVHHDALYEAYLNACLILVAGGAPLDPGIPFQRPDHIDHQRGFAHFGGPHILSLVTEVATRALKAVRFQKFNVHRRLRPEALAGRLEKADLIGDIAPGLLDMRHDLEVSGLLEALRGLESGDGNLLLPMAFPEGSPMHPSYGAGHATVAGACVTILKAFFDHGALLDATGRGAGHAFVASPGEEDGSCDSSLYAVDVFDGTGSPAVLTVEGELNKLASNISIGRNWAGVHYFTDYIESLRMGERIAIGVLEEQRLTYAENFSMTVPLFDGGTVRI